jgi:hypothetical protein
MTDGDHPHAGATVTHAAEMRDPEGTPPTVWLGDTAYDSIAVSIYVLVRDGSRRRLQLSAAMRGSIRLRFADDHPAVRIEFRGDEIEVADDLDGDAAPCDLELNGTLGDIAALIVAPLAGELPNPTTRAGRQAIVRLADGRVELDGPLVLARDLLRLLAVDADRAPTRSPTLSRA